MTAGTMEARELLVCRAEAACPGSSDRTRTNAIVMVNMRRKHRANIVSSSGNIIIYLVYNRTPVV